MGDDRVHGEVESGRRPAAGAPLWDEAHLNAPHVQPDKAGRVRRMFDDIAGTYERVNRLASFGLDSRWRRRAVDLAGVRADDVVLDVACGTGDLARAFAERAGCVVGVDFSAQMLALAAERGGTRLCWCRADALRLPFADEAFNMITCAFGVRNFQDLHTGLREMYRTLRPGGRAMILEFSMPDIMLLRWVYGLYFHWVLPRVATLISRDKNNAYRYLARSVASFVDRGEMSTRLRDSGFLNVRVFPMTLGVVVAYLAEKGS